MKRFQFRLESLLRLRRHERDLRRQELGQVVQAVSTLERQKLGIERRRHAELMLLRETTGPGSLDVDRILDARRFVGLLQARSRMAESQREALEQEIEQRRAATVEADRAVRALEKLRQRRWLRHRQDAQREENRQLDEAASSGWLRGI